jgi:hypothetical protein
MVKKSNSSIQDKDIIIVSESAFKRFVNTLSGGFSFDKFSLDGAF